MGDEVERDSRKTIDRESQSQIAMNFNSHMIYELQQKREYHFRKLMELQQAIDAVMRIS